MKARIPSCHVSTATRSLGLAVATILVAPSLRAATLTWDGGGADDNWSNVANWVGDPVSAPVNGDLLVFDGTARLAPNNDLASLVLGNGTSATSGSIVFAAGAGSFNLGGNSLSLGGTTGAGYTVITMASPNDQTISAGLTLGSGGGDRSVVMSGGGALTISGNLNFSNSWLFPTTTAGTLVLSGNNSGDGKGSIVIGGTNQMRAAIGSNVANANLVFGSDSALGNASTGSIATGNALFRGLQMRQNMNISTAGDRNLAGYAIAINNNSLNYNGADDLTIGHIIVQGGNRDLVVSAAGQLTVSGSLSVSHDQTSRALFLNLSGTGGAVITGSLYDTFHSGGVTTRTAMDSNGAAISGRFRKAGTGMLTLGGDSPAFTGEVSLEGGTTILTHPNALGATTGAASFTKTGDTTTGSDIIFTSDLLNLVVGQSVTGTGIPAGTTILNINTETLEVQLSQAATADGIGVTLSFSTTRSAPTAIGKAPALATLDLNGQTIAEPIHFLEGPGHNSQGVLINSNTGTPAVITADITGVYNCTLGGAGDITVPRLIATATRTITKIGTGTFTTNGTSHNNLCGWTINSGMVVLANTSGLASDRGTTINGGTLRLDGPNSNLINDGQAFSMTGGTFDLNGKSEAVASIDGAAGTVTNNGTGLSVLYVGGGVAGTSSGTFAGVIQDGTSALALTKEGTGTQTLTGACTYTGNTTVAAGILSLATAFLDNDSTVTFNSAAGAVLNLTHSDTDTVAGLNLGSGPLPAGEYGAVGSGADNEIPEITGTGKLLVFSSSGSPYDTWAAGFGGLSNPSADVDFENDGLPSGIEWVVGGNPTAADGPSVAPVLDSADPSKLIFVFRRTDEADGDFNTVIAVEYGSNLAGWTEAINGVDGVTITVADDFHGAGIDKVTVSIPKTLATSGKMFARLQVEITNP